MISTIAASSEELAVDASGEPVLATAPVAESVDSLQARLGEVHRVRDHQARASSISSCATADSSASSTADADPAAARADTWVYPTFNCAPFGIQTDLDATLALLAAAPPAGQVRLATAYLNPSPTLGAALARACPVGHVDILTAHPDSHGFRGARGVAGRLLPGIYDRLARAELLPWLATARAAVGIAAGSASGRVADVPRGLTGAPQGGRDGGKAESEGVSGVKAMDGDGEMATPIRLLGYRRPSWTYHAKGLWVEPGAGGGGGNDVIATVVGSSNFGRRSYGLDFEAQMVSLPDAPPTWGLALRCTQWPSN
jgi:phosphatidylserine/phosphatidylglycerophosphate/cardiolipin synthase-like enzyme